MASDDYVTPHLTLAIASDQTDDRCQGSWRHFPNDADAGATDRLLLFDSAVTEEKRNGGD